jgi:RNA polymerase subunit RPABC4/transcription elongation factor Spt4
MIANAAVGLTGGGIFGIILIAGAYLLPTIIAYTRKVTNVGSVFVINFFLGWTFIGWIVALAMSVKTKLPSGPTSQVTVVTGSNDRLRDNETATGPSVMNSAKTDSSQPSVSQVCKHCNQVLPTGAKFCIECGEPASPWDLTVSSSSVKGSVSTKWCDNCNTELDTNVKFCSQCGAETAEVNPFQCLECDGPITLEDKYCPMCGTKID